MVSLLRDLDGRSSSSSSSSDTSHHSRRTCTAIDNYSSLSFTQLRDMALARGAGPLDVAHIKRVNAAEADYWSASAGTRIDDSSNILGFGDCGGQTDRQQ